MLVDAGLDDRLRDAIAFVAAQVRRTVERYPGVYVMYTRSGRWSEPGAPWSHGWLPGLLWLLHGATDDPWFREQAERYTWPLEPRKLDPSTHDLGFLFLSTFARWHQLTGDPVLRDVVVTAGRTMASRFQPAGEYLCAATGPQSLFVDIMMNVGIVLYAARATGDEALRDIALRHCRTTRRVLVRGDGSVAHEGVFDPATGEFLRQSMQQGYRADSCWARGLAWSLYGFAAAYRDTGERALLDTAELNADYFVEHVPADGVPPWDFRAPAAERAQRDSSAAAVVASGLLELAPLASSSAKAELYRLIACRILDTLAGPPYLARGDDDWEGVLKHGTYHHSKRLGVDESLIWGDHYFVEAVAKLAQLRKETP
jgi:unsaturated chondroitin disaccharide hydrolase